MNQTSIDDKNCLKSTNVMIQYENLTTLNCYSFSRCYVGRSCFLTPWSSLSYLTWYFWMQHIHDDVIKWKHFPRYWPIVPPGNSPVTGEFPSQRPVTRSFDVFFDLRRNKRLGKQSRSRWFETPSRSLWHHSKVFALGDRFIFLQQKYWTKKQRCTSKFDFVEFNGNFNFLYEMSGT